MKLNKNLYAFFILITFFVKGISQPIDNVVAYYTFNGNANDVSGNGKNATVSGVTMTSDRLGKANAAYFFNGSNNMIILPTALLQSSNAFAISCWVKPGGNNTSPDTYNNQSIIDLRGQYQVSMSYNEPIHATAPNCVAFYIYNGSASPTVYSSNNSINVGTWYHILGNYGNNTMELYVNGILVGSLATTAPTSVSGYSNTIGKDYNTGINRLWFNGGIDQVLLYKRKLTSTEIKAIYDKELIFSEITELLQTTRYFNYDVNGGRIKRSNIIYMSSGNSFSRRDTISNDSTLIPQSQKIEDHFNGGKLLIYPNPTKGIITIELNGNDIIGGAYFKIFNSNGSLLKIQKASDGNVIDISKLSNGIYILKIEEAGKVSEWKIIKE